MSNKLPLINILKTKVHSVKNSYVHPSNYLLIVFRLHKFTGTVTLSSIGCQIVAVENVMTVEIGSPLSGADITAGCVARSSVMLAALKNCPVK